MNLRERLADALAVGLDDGSDADTDSQAQPRTSSSRRWGFGFRRSDRAVRVVVERDFSRDWRLYQSTPLLRAPINQYAADVVEPGYRVLADSDDTQEFLSEWCSRAAVVGGERNRDLRELLRAIPIQLEARGTALVEHAPARGDASRIAGLTLIDPATVTPFRQPGTDMLVLPSDTDLDDVRETDEGEAAAYVQHIDSTDERRLSQTDITKLDRDADVGDVFGVSSINAVADRVEALKGKLADHEEAIAAQAYGRWFYFLKPYSESDGIGGETTVEFDAESVDRFAESLEAAGPGDQVVLDAPVEVENLPGEVAEIIETLKFDVDYILSAMPSMKYALGAFDGDINRRVTQEQAPRYEKAVSATQGRLARALSPVLATVARQNGFDPSGVRLSLSPPEHESPVLSLSDEEVERIERFSSAISTLAGSGGAASLVNREALLDLVLQLPSDAAASTSTPSTDEDGDSEEANAAALVPTGVAVEEAVEALADEESEGTPAPEEAELAGEIEAILFDLREALLVAVREEIEAAAVEADSETETDSEALAPSLRIVARVERALDSALSRVLREARVREGFRALFERLVRRTVEEVAAPDHTPADAPSIDASFGVADEPAIEFYAETVENAVEDASDDVYREIRREVRAGLDEGLGYDALAARIEERVSDESIRQRARLIALMEIQSSINGVRLSEYRDADVVLGVTYQNPCDTSTTKICERVAGCSGDPATLYFDDGPLAEQLDAVVPDSERFEGFKSAFVPPLHFGCRTGVRPVTRREDS